MPNDLHRRGGEKKEDRVLRAPPERKKKESRRVEISGGGGRCARMPAYRGREGQKEKGGLTLAVLLLDQLAHCLRRGGRKKKKRRKIHIQILPPRHPVGRSRSNGAS